MENYKQVLAVIQKLQSLKVEKMGQILCVKKVPFCKSGHIYNAFFMDVPASSFMPHSS